MKSYECIKNWGWNAELFNSIKKGLNENDGDFIISLNEKNHYAVIVRKVFDAKYVYAEKYYSREKAFEKLILNDIITSPIVIEKDNVYYIKNAFDFAPSEKNSEFPDDNVKFLSDISEEYSKRYERETENLYNDIEVDYPEDGYTEFYITELEKIYDKIGREFDIEKIEKGILNLEATARRYQLFGTDVSKVAQQVIKDIINSNTHIITQFDVLNDILGYTSIEDTINNTVSLVKEKIKEVKLREGYIEMLINNNLTTEQYERDITKSLNAVSDKVKTVYVTFTLSETPNTKIEEYKRKDITEKINVYTLIKHIEEKLDFKASEFIKKEWLGLNSIFTELNKIDLPIENISKITHRKTVMFER
jgi:hypothetical protein